MAKRDLDARSVAYQLLLAVDKDDAYANLLLPKILADAGLDSRDAAFAQELSFGTLRQRYFYDLIIEKCASRSADEIDLEALNLLRIGAHQLLGMRVPSHAALSETVNLAKRVAKASLTGFVNGVLRRISEKSRDEWLQILLKNCVTDIERLAVKYSHPQWIIRALQDSLSADSRSDEIELLLESDNIAPLVSLVALPGLATRDDLFELGASLDGYSPIGANLQEGDPANEPLIQRGLVRVQDQGSQLAALALEGASAINEHEEWLDLCAGPGGKAALLAALAVRDSAELVCNELQPHRAKLVEKALKPINSSIYVRVGDGRDLGQDAPNNFDRVLLDAPCSGLGALRRRPESRYRKQPKDVSQLSKLQQQLFESAFNGTKPGGITAYVTCSPHLAETTAIVDWASRKFSGQISLLDAREILGMVNPQLLGVLPEGRKTVQLWPHIHNTDAMFIALFRKESA